MGIWATPFASLKAAKKFSLLMSKPWIAQVKKAEYGYIAKVNGLIQLWGSDSTVDYLDAIASKKRKDFDIRKILKEDVKSYTLYICDVIPFAEISGSPLDALRSDKIQGLKIINQVRKSMDLKPIPHLLVLNESQKSFQILHDIFKTNKVSLLYRNFLVYEKAKTYDLWIGIPKKYLNKTFNVGEFQIKSKSKKSTDVLKQIKKLPFVIEVKSVNSSYSNSIKVLVIFKGSRAKDVEDLDGNETLKTSYHLIYNKDNSNKFWEALIQKSQVKISFGRIGATPRKQVKQFASKELALAFLSKKLKEKLSKGYIDHQN